MEKCGFGGESEKSDPTWHSSIDTLALTSPNYKVKTARIEKPSVGKPGKTELEGQVINFHKLHKTTSNTPHIIWNWAHSNGQQSKISGTA